MNDLIVKLKENDIYLALNGEELKVQFNSDAIPPDLLEEIRSNKTQLIEFLKARQSKSEDYEPIPLAPELESYPLSSAQRRLWTICQLDEVNIAYSEHQLEFLEGKLNSEALNQAFLSLIQRHEVLRTSFREDENEEVKQWIIPAEEVDFSVEIVEQGKQKCTYSDLLQHFLSQPFDFKNAPLFRVIAIEVESEKWVVCYLMHHIICDGWTIELIRKEFFALYSRYSGKSKETLKPLRLQYKDYAYWQQSQLQEDRMKEHREYWLDRFEKKAPELDFATDFQRSAFKTYSGAKVRTFFKKETLTGLEELCRANGGTLFMGLISVVKCLMYKYTGQTDIVLGSPIAGREHSDLEDQLGFFLNTLALRTSFESNRSFLELFQSVRQTTLEAYEHQSYPFDELVENVPYKFDKSRTPFYDVMVGLLNTKVGANSVREQESIEVDNIEYENEDSYEQVMSKFDMTFNFIERKGGLYLGLEYNKDLYKKSSIVRLLSHFERLLNSILESPADSISQLNYLCAEEVQMLESMSETSGNGMVDQTIVDAFRKTAASNPEALAICFDNQVLSYKELDALSTQFASSLNANFAMTSEAIVALKMERSHKMVVAMLGVLKTGGAYLPLDANHPEQRIISILEDSKPVACIDDAMFDAFIKNTKDLSKDVKLAPIGVNNLAYVLYTSGSTGTPKGVLVEHGSVMNLIQAYQLESGLRSSLTTNFIFDVSVLEVFSALLSGGTLFIPTIEQVMDPASFAVFIEQNKIEHAYVHPMLLTEVSDALNQTRSTLKRILTGVQSIKTEAIRWYIENGVEVYNGYGPTETTVCATMYKVNPEQLPETRHLPIGKPLSNNRIHIVDTAGNPVGLGMSGEIWISGAGVTRGYLNRAELTSEMYIDSPFKIGEKVYKTGDYGRWLDDGNSEFLGRRDNQLKISGYRIEIGEVEAAIEKVDFVHQCAVVSIQEKNGENALVGFIVINYGVSPDALTTELKKRLPEYMVPKYFLKVDALPMNENGKVDKSALPDPESAGITPMVDYVAPETDIQKKLVEIWEELLGADKVGIKDDFFLLGGNSLKVIRLISKINKEFGLKYDLKGVYSESTIELIAEKIRVDTWFKTTGTQTEEYEEIKI